MTVGENIRAVRESKGFTQKQVADACGMADSAIRKYESGVVRPKIGTITKIADALGVETLELTKGDPYYPIRFMIKLDGDAEKFKNDVAAALFGEARTRISRALDKLNDEGQQKAVERVEELTEIPKYQREETPPAATEEPTEGK